MKTRIGHPPRAGLQQELREKLYEVFEWVESQPGAQVALTEELLDCVRDEFGGSAPAEELESEDDEDESYNQVALNRTIASLEDAIAFCRELQT